MECKRLGCTNEVKKGNKFCSRSCSTIDHNSKRDYSVISRTQSKPHRDEYELNSKYCLQCMTKIPYEKKENIYCNRSCRTTHLNNERQDGPITDENAWRRYQWAARFRFDTNNYSQYLDLSLVEEHGWFGKDNVQGVARDHMFSLREGFDKGIAPDIVGHVANCKIVLQLDNVRKGSVSSITIEELQEKIENFNR